MAIKSNVRRKIILKEDKKGAGIGYTLKVYPVYLAHACSGTGTHAQTSTVKLYTDGMMALVKSFKVTPNKTQENIHKDLVDILNQCETILLYIPIQINEVPSKIWKISNTLHYKMFVYQ